MNEAEVIPLSMRDPIGDYPLPVVEVISILSPGPPRIEWMDLNVHESPPANLALGELTQVESNSDAARFASKWGPLGIDYQGRPQTGDSARLLDARARTWEDEPTRAAWFAGKRPKDPDREIPSIL